MLLNYQYTPESAYIQTMWDKVDHWSDSDWYRAQLSAAGPAQGCLRPLHPQPATVQQRTGFHPDPVYERER